MFSIVPKAPEARNWTKGEWKLRHRYCRMIAKMLRRHDALVTRKTDEAFKNLCLYGHSILHITPEELQ